MTKEPITLKPHPLAGVCPKCGYNRSDYNFFKCMCPPDSGGSGGTTGAELLPCPFSHHFDQLRLAQEQTEPYVSDEGDGEFSVVCRVCGGSTRRYYRRDMAVRAWNTRANSQLVTAEITRLQDERNALAVRGADREELVTELVEALRQIANHQHNFYDQVKGDPAYSTGVVDGHRCAAQIAQAVLASLTPPLINLPLESVGLKAERDDSL